MPVLVDLTLDKPLFSRLRQELLLPVSGDILEMGVGTGLNLPCYPEDVKTVYAVDPNDGNLRRLRKRSGPRVEFAAADGASLPYEDEQFDFVVSTWTMCSIENLTAALGEIFRVLRPGGTFLFLEHGLHQEDRIQRWQKRFNPIQKLVGDGCRLDRNYFADIQMAGLQLRNKEVFVIDKMPAFVQTHYRGRAVKPTT